MLNAPSPRKKGRVPAGEADMGMLDVAERVRKIDEDELEDDYEYNDDRPTLDPVDRPTDERGERPTRAQEFD